eukprot:3577485-Amphidinium_carterae.2
MTAKRISEAEYKHSPCEVVYNEKQCDVRDHDPRTPNRGCHNQSGSSEKPFRVSGHSAVDWQTLIDSGLRAKTRPRVNKHLTASKRDQTKLFGLGSSTGQRQGRTSVQCC